MGSFFRGGRGCDVLRLMEDHYRVTYPRGEKVVLRRVNALLAELEVNGRGLSAAFPSEALSSGCVIPRGGFAIVLHRKGEVAEVVVFDRPTRFVLQFAGLTVTGSEQGLTITGSREKHFPFSKIASGHLTLDDEEVFEETGTLLGFAQHF